MEYEKFREFASKVFPMTLLVKLASDPLAFSELLQSPQFRRFMAAAYKADSLSENSRETIYSVGGELNGALDQIRDLDLADLIEYCQLLLQTPSTLTGANFVNQSLTKQLAELEAVNNSLLVSKGALENKIVELELGRKKDDENMVKTKYDHRKKVFTLNQKILTIKEELIARRTQFFFRTWGLIHGSTSSTPKVGGLSHLIGVTPSAEVTSTEELPDQISGTALLLRPDGTVCELPFSFSMKNKLVEIREKVTAEQARQSQSSHRPEKSIPPEGVVKLRYQGVVQRMIYELYSKERESLEPIGILIGFVQARDLGVAISYPRNSLERKGGLQKLPFALCTSSKIASENSSRFGIVTTTTIERQQRLTVTVSTRGGCFPILFRPERKVKETKPALP